MRFIRIYLIGVALTALGSFVMSRPGRAAPVGGLLLCFAGSLFILHRFLLDLRNDWKEKRFNLKNPNVRWLAVLIILEAISIPSYFHNNKAEMANPVLSVLITSGICVLIVVARHLGED